MVYLFRLSFLKLFVCTKSTASTFSSLMILYVMPKILKGNTKNRLFETVKKKKHANKIKSPGTIQI